MYFYGEVKMNFINGKTKPLAIIGYPVGHSLSPLMHNIFFQFLGLNNVYIPLEIKPGHLQAAIEALWTLGFMGANITIPYKEEVIPLLPEISSEAELIGAVNTLVRKENGFRGHNTDGQGFLKALSIEKGWEPHGKKVVILGAGGSARAIGISLALKGAHKITIINRNLLRARGITEIVEKQIGVHGEIFGWNNPMLERVIREGDIIINTTPLGMNPNINEIPPLDTKWLSPSQLLVDLIYNPLETRLMKEAKAQGCQVSNGLGMLIYQGVLSFKLWTGQEPPLENIRETLEKYLNKV